jgi:Protein of unknown function (DUF2973)
MLHILYILAFTILAFLAVGNLIRNLMTLGLESQRGYGSAGGTGGYDPNRPTSYTSQRQVIPHPELLDENGKFINEPLLVMRSMTVESARERLDALYEASPNGEAQDAE